MSFIKISNVRSRPTSRNELERVFKLQLSEAQIKARSAFPNFNYTHTIVKLIMFESIYLGKR